MKKDFVPPALVVQKDKPLIYTAMSKHLFYYRMFISAFVLKQGGVPLNPFMVFDYFLLDAVDRDLVREGNNNLVKRCDQLWVFGAVSNGLLAEIRWPTGKARQSPTLPSIIRARSLRLQKSSPGLSGM